MGFKIGDRVKISKKAVKRFYGREERFNDYIRPQDLYLSSEDFIEFVDDSQFNTGKSSGVVIGTGAELEYIRVQYEKVTGGYNYTFIEDKDLVKIK